jgi:hypothetical protein
VALPYYVNQLEREGNLYNERITLGLGFIYTTSISLLLYEFFKFYGFTSTILPNFLIYIIIFGSVLGFILVKAMFTYFSGITFKTVEHSHAYRLNELIFNHITGLIIMPVLLLILYWQPQPFLWIAFSMAVIMLIYRFLRSISIGFSNTKFSVFYLILYLCTLEILPLLLLVKVIRQL